MKVATCLLFLGLGMPMAGPAVAQSGYPDRTIRLLYGFPPGNDTTTRLVADKLAERLGKPVVVENIAGAAGNIAADRTAKAEPDGYTIGMLTGANVVLRPLLYSKLPYDPLKELVPVSLILRFTNLVAVNNDVPARTVQELIALARSSPGKLTFGHNGAGSVTHLSGELLNVVAKIDTRPVPYRGPSALLTDLIAGQISMAINTSTSTLPLAREGKIRALAVTSRTRAPFVPDLPTVAESGYPAFETSVWFGLFVPAGTPQPVIDRLGLEVARIMGSPDVRGRFLDLHQSPIGNTPSEFDQVIRTEVSYWGRLIKGAGIGPLD
jgi:tripartite-type tricarboxylate transporter receptor subunit TctC